MHRKTTENAVFTRNFEFIDPLRSFDRNMVFNYTNLTIRKGLYYKLPVGFDTAVTYRNSESLFNDLWFDWMYDQLLTTVLGTPLVDLDYKEIYKRLPKEKQEEIMARRDYFREMSGVELSREENL